MPPKGWRKTSDGFKPVNSSGTPVKEKQDYGLDDLLLPKKTVQELAASTLPEKTSIPSEGLLALRRSTAVFISYISAEANRLAQQNGRKTIQPNDVLKAIENCELAQFLPSVKNQLEDYESYMASKKQSNTETDKTELKEMDHEISDDDEKRVEDDIEDYDVKRPRNTTATTD